MAEDYTHSKNTLKRNSIESVSSLIKPRPSLATTTDPKENLNLAPIGNCNVHFLVNHNAEIVYGCMPQMDSNPVFNRLINSSPTSSLQTSFSIEIEDFSHSTSSYIPNTAILVTTKFDTHGNSVRITDFCPLYEHYRRVYNPPLLIRMIKPCGSPRIRTCLSIAAHLGSDKKVDPITNSNSIIYPTEEDATFRLTSDIPINYVKNETYFCPLKKLNIRFYTDTPLEKDLDVENRGDFEQTLEYWGRFSRTLFLPLEWQKEVIRAAITLKLCQNWSTGAIVAALTTSIPEADDDKGRNWDYRFCWVRDSYHIVQALNRLGSSEINERYLEFIVNVLSSLQDGQELHPLYGVFLDSRVEERVVAGLSGYRGKRPVRVGNGAYSQAQNDTFGSIILSVKQLFFDSRVRVDEGWALLEKLERVGDLAFANYRAKDSGIWELRGTQQVHTHSVTMCWAACMSLAQISEIARRGERARHWKGRADEIAAFIEGAAWSEKFQTYLAVCYDAGAEGDRRALEGLEEGDLPLDASLLLMGPLGLCGAGSERFAKTVHKIGEVLLRDGFMFRYLVKDDFGTPKNSFTICTFWYIDALALIGEVEKARGLFENLLDHRNKYGVLSEGISIEERELWGNYPQAYSMVGIINSALKLSRSWSSVGL